MLLCTAPNAVHLKRVHLQCVTRVLHVQNRVENAVPAVKVSEEEPTMTVLGCLNLPNPAWISGDPRLRKCDELRSVVRGLGDEGARFGDCACQIKPDRLSLGHSHAHGVAHDVEDTLKGMGESLLACCLFLSVWQGKNFRLISTGLSIRHGR
jgi:hypothetical protein